MGSVKSSKCTKFQFQNCAEYTIFQKTAHSRRRASSPNHRHKKMRGYSLPLQTLRLVKLLRLLVQVRADCLLPTASLSPTAARGGFSSTCPPPTTRLFTQRTGASTPVLNAHKPHCRPHPSPHLVTIVYHSFGKKSTGNFAQISLLVFVQNV